MTIDLSNAVVFTQHAQASPGDAKTTEDGRFAVINGLMFELARFVCEDDVERFIVSVYDADGVFNPSYHSDMGASYNAEYFVLAVEYSNAEQATESFLDLQRAAMKNSQALLEELNREAGANDL